jgi:hypothetical protein
MNLMESLGFKCSDEGILNLRSSNPWWNFTRQVLVILLIVLIVVSIGRLFYNSHNYWEGFTLVISIFLFVLSPLILLSLLAVYQTTTINPTTRAITILRKRLWGKNKLTLNFSMDSTRIESTRMGVTDANPHDVWIVKAGVVTDQYQLGILSKETASVDECKKLMLDLYHFFYPDQTTVTADNIITNGSQAYVLSDASKVEFEKKMGMDADEPVYLENTK